MGTGTDDATNTAVTVVAEFTERCWRIIASVTRVSDYETGNYCYLQYSKKQTKKKQRR